MKTLAIIILFLLGLVFVLETEGIYTYQQASTDLKLIVDEILNFFTVSNST